MRVTTAFFAGAGTVVVAIGAGLGGGLLLGDIMSPQQPKQPSSEMTRLEQRMSPQPIPANGATQPVPYMATTQVAATIGEQAAQPKQEAAPPQAQPQQAQPQQAQPQVQQASTQPAAEPKPNPAPQPVPAAQPSAPAEQSAARATPEDSFAKARDGDFKRDARRPEDRDRRKAERRQQWDERRQQWDERRQQWVDKRKWRQRENDDLGDVETSVREATESREPRSFFGREPRFENREPRFGSREPGFGSGRFNLFDD